MALIETLRPPYTIRWFTRWIPSRSPILIPTWRWRRWRWWHARYLHKVEIEKRYVAIQSRIRELLLLDAIEVMDHQFLKIDFTNPFLTRTKFEVTQKQGRWDVVWLITLHQRGQMWMHPHWNHMSPPTRTRIRTCIRIAIVRRFPQYMYEWINDVAHGLKVWN